MCGAALVGAGLFGMVAPTYAQGQPSAASETAQNATYADLTALAEASELVIRAEIRRQTRLKPERAPGLAPGFARLYIEADTQALIAGSTSVGESLAYLVDVPLNEKGKPPKLKRREMLLFANAVPGQRGSIQLAGKHAQFDYSPALEARLRPILTGLVAADKPPVITGIADALAVPGTLVGESETQVFLTTDNGSPVSLSVIRRPGQQPAWGVSWGEIIDSSARPPQGQTLRWYRLACSLPNRLPSSANLARDPTARNLAARDYAFIMDELGPCERRLTEPA
ncbi:MAG: hypothetical protein AAF250_14230 [Pseudomonadota bacterium]